MFFTNLTLPQGLWWRFCPFLQEMRAEKSEKSPRAILTDGAEFLISPFAFCAGFRPLRNAWGSAIYICHVPLCKRKS